MKSAGCIRPFDGLNLPNIARGQTMKSDSQTMAGVASTSGGDSSRWAARAALAASGNFIIAVSKSLTCATPKDQSWNNEVQSLSGNSTHLR
jgi:hypothetical protein